MTEAMQTTELTTVLNGTTESPVEMVWVDFETNTTHQYGSVVPFEVGVKATNSLGKVYAEFSTLVIPVNFKLWIDDLSAYVREMHGKSGLLSDLQHVIQDPKTSADCHPHNVDRRLQKFLDGLPVDAKTLPMSGSTVFFDRRVMEEHMPNSHGWFTHRNIDVSTLKEACKLINPAIADAYKAKTKDFVKGHRPLADIDASIMEWLFYRENFLWEA